MAVSKYMLSPHFFIYHTPTTEINSKEISIPVNAGKKSPCFFIKGENIVGKPSTAYAKEIIHITVNIVGRFITRISISLVFLSLN